MDPVRSVPPLHALAALLPERKAATARRLVLSGRAPERAAFRGHAALTNAEAERLAAWERAGLASQVIERAESSDGSVRLVVRLADGERVETVAMPSRAVCVSTQVGCAVACRFCASGLLGLERNLAAHEIVEQVVHARRAMPIDRVLYMGMGEPSHNLDAVLAAVEFLKEHGGIGPGRQTFSTIGSCAALARMGAARVKPCLALSLHAADEKLRAELVPHASAEPLRDLVAAAARYAGLQGKPILFEWTLLAGVNDRDEDADALADLVRGVRGCVNFIRWNPVAGLSFAPSSFERALALRERVKSHGILATIRASTGADVDAACGQLRRRAAAPSGSPA